MAGVNVLMVYDARHVGQKCCWVNGCTLRTTFTMQS